MFVCLLKVCTFQDACVILPTRFGMSWPSSLKCIRLKFWWLGHQEGVSLITGRTIGSLGKTFKCSFSLHEEEDWYECGWDGFLVIELAWWVGHLAAQAVPKITPLTTIPVQTIKFVSKRPDNQVPVKFKTYHIDPLSHTEPVFTPKPRAKICRN